MTHRFGLTMDMISHSALGLPASELASGKPEKDLRETRRVSSRECVRVACS